MFKLKLEMNGEVYKSSADSISEAIGKLDYPPSAKAGMLNIKKGNKEYNTVIYPRVLRKLSANNIFRQFFEKRLKFHFQ